ncbi:hypothetical protein F5Y16DRAFT_410582 [Xylariaceae sp. FL0255]|nr:hypothetical protein F5Y16DRAFT_410582 [Xylariaceae sp. FL0255]
MSRSNRSDGQRLSSGLPVLDRESSPLQQSRQAFADSYKSGARLWTKEYLADIEKQLRQLPHAPYFRLRRIDGSIVEQKNPFFGEQKPTGRPYIKFRHYWSLLSSKPEGPPETWHCSYLVDWDSEERLLRGVFSKEDIASLYRETKQRWRASLSYRLLETQLKMLLDGKKVTKVVCFGLGDLHRRPPRWWLEAERKQNPKGVESDARMFSLVQHSVVLTIADILRSRAKKDTHVRLLTQDPDYLEQTRELLEEDGFEIVGMFGAGGFAEVDDESLVFSVYPSVPVNQIIADVARPVLMIINGAYSDEGLKQKR